SFTAAPPSDIYTLSLHDALPICDRGSRLQFTPAGDDGQVGNRHGRSDPGRPASRAPEAMKIYLACTVRGDRRGLLAGRTIAQRLDRKSTRLNSSHVSISYAVFCL